METIRIGTFETNSSSTHSITMCMEDEFEKWKKGDLYYLISEERFLNKEEKDIYLKRMFLKDKMEVDYNNKTISLYGIVTSYENYTDREHKMEELITSKDIETIDQEEFENFIDNFDDYTEKPLTYREYLNNVGENYDTYTNVFTTPSGEKVVSFGYYGNDW